MELKPCPFCGGVANLVEASLATKVVCVGCGAETGYHYDFAFGSDCMKNAIEHWNTRAERTCKDATSEEHTQAFTCSECGCWVAYDEYWETGIYVQGDGHAVHIHPHYCPSCGAKVVSE